VVLTLGAQGCLWAAGGRGWALLPAPAVEPVDTTGAGDALPLVSSTLLAAERAWRQAPHG